MSDYSWKEKTTQTFFLASVWDWGASTKAWVVISVIVSNERGDVSLEGIGMRPLLAQTGEHVRLHAEL